MCRDSKFLLSNMSPSWVRLGWCLWTQMPKSPISQSRRCRTSQLHGGPVMNSTYLWVDEAWTQVLWACPVCPASGLWQWILWVLRVVRWGLHGSDLSPLSDCIGIRAIWMPNVHIKGVLMFPQQFFKLAESRDPYSVCTAIGEVRFTWSTTIVLQ